VMIVKARAFTSIPDTLEPAAAALGDMVAVQGIGGVGHLGVQFAWKMIFVPSLSDAEPTRSLAKQLGLPRNVCGEVRSRKATFGMGRERGPRQGRANSKRTANWLSPKVASFTSLSALSDSSGSSLGCGKFSRSSIPMNCGES
jgi:hypothetical protein